MAPHPADYSERLSAPLRWWVQATMLAASIWLAVVVALPATAAWAVTGVFVALFALALWSYGNVQVAVRDGVLHAGRARIEARWLGTATALDAETTRELAGPRADARAFLVMRPYLKRAVRVEVLDPDDPTPYWLISSRRPEQLAASLTGLNSGLTAS